MQHMVQLNTWYIILLLKRRPKAKSVSLLYMRQAKSHLLYKHMARLDHIPFPWHASTFSHAVYVYSGGHSHNQVTYSVFFAKRYLVQLILIRLHKAHNNRCSTLRLSSVHWWQHASYKTNICKGAWHMLKQYTHI